MKSNLPDCEQRVDSDAFGNAAGGVEDHAAWNGHTVVMACTLPYWSSLQVGSQHIARQLARRGFGVVYFSAPVTPLHLLKLGAFEVRKRLVRAINGPATFLDGMIKAYEPAAAISPDSRPILRSRLVTGHWWRTCFTAPGGFSGLRPGTLLYVDNPFYGFLLRRYPGVKSVFRIVDNYDRFKSWKSELRNAAAMCAQRADLTVYSAETLESYVERLSPRRMALLENGVDYRAFSEPEAASPRPAAFDGIAGPVILYSGAVDNRIDFELVARVADKLPDVSFVFVGPVRVNRGTLVRRRNVRFTGPVDHDRLPVLMRHSIAGMIPFDVSGGGAKVAGIRSLKLLEYLAAGLPVISSRWEESENAVAYTWLYRDPDEFVGLVRRAAAGRYDPEPGRDYARSVDWSHVVRRLLGLMDEAGYPV